MPSVENPAFVTFHDAEQISNQIGTIHTVQTLASSEPALNEGGIRWTIFQHKQDLIDYGAIFYNGKKLLIDRDLFISFLKKG
jgi:hypothetical protein